MLVYFLLLLCSLLIGSFLNVVIYRLPRKESVIWPGSHCDNCGQRLNILDLIPIMSYVSLQGKCRYCGGGISRQYPLVEALTTISFMLVYFKWGLSLESLAGCFFTAILIVAAFTDINSGVIPDSLTYTGIITGLIFSGFTLGIKASLVGMGLFGGFYLLIAVLSRGGMGGGDVKLAAAIGAFLGAGGAIMVFILSSVLGVLWVLPILMRGKANRKTAIKFGPFMSLAAWLVLLYGSELLYWYQSLLTAWM